MAGLGSVMLRHESRRMNEWTELGFFPLKRVERGYIKLFARMRTASHYDYIRNQS
jgi:hypothetical protein